MIAFPLRVFRIVLLLSWGLSLGFFSAFLVFRRGWAGIRNAVELCAIWARGIIWIINCKVAVHGDPSIAKGGLIVSNHLSYLDVLVQAGIFKPRFTPKSTVADWPLLGPYLKMGRPIWIDRSSKQSSITTLAEFRDTMLNSINLLVYPEGTSTDGTKEILPFKSTPFEAVTKENIPVYPILTFYSQKPGQPSVCWYGDMTLVPHVWKILGIWSFGADIYVLDPIRPDGRDRKELAELVYSTMLAKYREIAASRKQA